MSNNANTFRSNGEYAPAIVGSMMAKYDDSNIRLQMASSILGLSFSSMQRDAAKQMFWLAVVGGGLEAAMYTGMAVGGAVCIVKEGQLLKEMGDTQAARQAELVRNPDPNGPRAIEDQLADIPVLENPAPAERQRALETDRTRKEALMRRKTERSAHYKAEMHKLNLKGTRLQTMAASLNSMSQLIGQPVSKITQGMTQVEQWKKENAGTCQQAAATTNQASYDATMQYNRTDSFSGYVALVRG